MKNYFSIEIMVAGGFRYTIYWDVSENFKVFDDSGKLVYETGSLKDAIQQVFSMVTNTLDTKAKACTSQRLHLLEAIKSFDKD